MTKSTAFEACLNACPGCDHREFAQIHEIPWEFPIPVRLCTRCGLVFQGAPLDGEQLKKYYAANSIFYSHGVGSRQDMLVKARHAFLGKALECVQGNYPRLLDVGCGFGDFLASFDPNSWECIGIELNAERAKYARNCYGLRVLESTLEDSGIEKGSVHLLTGFGLIEHFSTIREFLASVHDILAPGGLGFFSVADLASPDHGVSDYFSVEHILYFNANTLESLIVGAGFTPLRTGPLTPPDYKDIACLFRKDSENFRWGGMKASPQDVAVIQDGTNSYVMYRLDYIERLKHSLSSAGLLESNLRLGIYGAGGHTIQLIEGIPELNKVAFFFDSDPQKHGNDFLKGKVYAPADIAKLGLDAVIISSRAFEDEIFNALRPIAPSGTRIVTLYKQPGEA